jgi:hypothetical protein
VLAAFCGELGVRLARTSRSAAEHRKAAAALLTRDGVPLPKEPGPPPDITKRRFKLPPGGIPGAPRSGAAELKWDETACVDALARWLRLLPAGAKRTRQAYLDYSVGKADFPAPNQFDRHGGFAKLRGKAQARINLDRSRD